MKNHLIFDFDGVIADTFDMNHALCLEIDASMTPEDFLAHHDGNVYETPRIKFSEDGVKFYVSNYRERIASSHIERARPWVEKFAETYSLYIVSSNTEAAVHSVLKDVGIDHLFVSILGKETDRSKVAKFELLKREYGVTESNAVFVTDTLGDIHEAKRVGLPTIAVTFGYHNRDRLKAGEPAHIVDSWEEVAESVSGLILKSAYS